MKRSNYILTVFTLLTINLLTNNFFTYSQDCLPEGITFTTQEQIDNFQTNYPGCTEIEGNVSIVGEDITDLNGLNVLTSIGGFLKIWDCDSLDNLNGLESLTSIGGDLSIQSNGGLINLEGLSGINEVYGNLSVEINSQMISLSGVDNLVEVHGNMTIGNHYNLSSFDGLNNLESINGNFIVYYCDVLTNFSGLENLTAINGKLVLHENIQLTNIESLLNLTSIGGDIDISFNDDLESLFGLDNIDPNSIENITIIGNYNLTDCDVWSICQYLTAPNGTVYFYNNGEGCNGVAQIEEACLTGMDEIIEAESNIQIFPNPAKKTISVISSDQTKIRQIKIFNQTGVLTIEENNPGNKIDVSSLQPGLYFVEIKTDAGIVREKLIIQ